MRMRDPGSRYLVRFFGWLAGLLIIAAAANLLVDPYDVTRLVRVSGFNRLKPAEWENARRHKPFDLLRGHYDTAVIGTSQVERGVDPDAPALHAHGIALYNLGLSELRLDEAASLLDFAADCGIVRALITLDFVRYNRPSENPEASLPHDWNKTRLFLDHLRTLVSSRSLLDALRTVEVNWRGQPSLEHLPGGMLNLPQYLDVVGWPDYRRSFDQVDAVYVNDTYRPLRDRLVAGEHASFDHAALRRILAIARQRGVDVRFVIPPTHARAQEVIAFLGLTQVFERWKAELVGELEREGSARGAEPFALWDFSGFNAATTEAIPASGDPAARMTWFYDPIHFTPAMGALVLDRVLALGDPRFLGLADAGAPLTAATLDAHAQTLRERRRAFLARDGSFAEAPAALYREPPLAAPRRSSTGR